MNTVERNSFPPTRKLRYPLPMIYLREVLKTDLPRWFEIQDHVESQQMAGYPRRTWDEFKIHWETKMNLPEVENRVILLDKEIVGTIALFSRDGLREVGYVIDLKHWGKGIASEAVKLFFQEVTERPVHAFVQVENRPSARVLEKNHFQKIGKKIEGNATLWGFRLD